MGDWTPTAAANGTSVMSTWSPACPGIYGRLHDDTHAVMGHPRCSGEHPRRKSVKYHAGKHLKAHSE